MAYQVLSRKWRPQKFEDVVGQQHVATTLQNSIKQDRLAHAYLFTGPRGVGKTTTARILAKFLNCQNPDGLNPCNECKNCREIAAGRSFDVMEIDGASNNGVENIRELREAVKYPPTDGNYRIYIIDEVHMLSTSAFNALLKTLEEPPDHVKFVFATTEPEAVLPTIISRTQRFDFKRIPVPKIVELLRTICNSEEVKISDGALNLIARKADGGMRDAESLLDQVISFSGTDISDEDVASILGIVNYELYIRLSEILSESDINGALELIQEVMVSGFDLREFLNGLSDFWRNLLVLKSTEDPALMEVPDSYHEDFSRIADTYDARDLLRLLNLTLSTQQQFKYVRNQRIFVENFLLKLVHFSKSVSLDEIINADEHVSTEGSAPQKSNPSPAPQKKRSGAAARRKIGAKRTDYSRRIRQDSSNGDNEQPAATPETGVETEEKSGGTLPPVSEFQSRWDDFVEFVREEKGFMAEYMSHSEPVNVNGRVLELMFDTSHAFFRKRAEEKSDEVETLIQKFFNVSVRLKARSGQREQTTESDDEEDIIDDPITQAIIKNFDGEIIR